MKNRAALLLALVAIPIYLWDSHELLYGIFGVKSHVSARTASASPANFGAALSIEGPHFENKGRSPFVAYTEKTKPAEIPAKAKKPPPKPAAVPPKIAITGIMWNPSNPIAMVTLPDGSSAAVKLGQTVGNFKFKTIEKTRVLVAVDGNEFWIAK